MNNNRLDRELRPAVFLDRDGTLNVEKDYLYRVEDFEFIPGAPEAIKLLKDAGYLVIVVTNQSGVARGYYSLEDVARLHEHLSSCLAPLNVRIDGYYVCPHHPTAGVGAFKSDCTCRKPNPGMLLEAARDLHVDLSRSWMIGDKVADVEAGRRAGVRPLFVRTGHGVAEERGLKHSEQECFASVVEAARFIVDDN